MTRLRRGWGEQSAVESRNESSVADDDRYVQPIGAISWYLEVLAPLGLTSKLMTSSLGSRDLMGRRIEQRRLSARQ